jgi:hypothetical protein
MALRPPAQYSTSGKAEALSNLLDYEIAAEKASSLGRAGRRVEAALAELRAFEGGPNDRLPLLAAAAEAVYAYFIQREICGMRRHHDVIREYAIPNEVLVRLGAK